MTIIEEMGVRAKAAAHILSTAGNKKEKALKAAARAIVEHSEEILEANLTDLEAARKNGMTESLIDRLMLDNKRLAEMSKAFMAVAEAADPVGLVLSGETRPNGLKIEKVSVPLGVIGIIFEARPNVTSDATALCIKAGNAVILRGGKEAYISNSAIVGVLRHALEEQGLPADSVQLIEDTSRASAAELMALTEYLDVLIPRGGAGLIRNVKQNAKVPVIETGVGNCHLYVDEFADIDMAADIIENAKISRPSVCNALETVLVHEKIAEKALPKIWARLKKKVEIRGCRRTGEILAEIKTATEEDWATEFLDYILAVKIVDSIDEALCHIAKYSSGHSEAIVTESLSAAERFLNEVDSAAVYVNASTRFTDGAEFGLGAEIGISTQKLHARGPMGLSQLTSHKFIIRGNGQIR